MLETPSFRPSRHRDRDLPLQDPRPNLRPILETSLRIRTCIWPLPVYGVVDVHAIRQSLFNGVQDISVNVIELQGFFYSHRCV